MDIVISTTQAPDANRLMDLFREAGWDDKTEKDRLDTMLRNSTTVATAWLGERMVGFARCLSDRALSLGFEPVENAMILHRRR